MSNDRHIPFVKILILFITILMISSQGTSHVWIEGIDCDQWLDDMAAAACQDPPTSPLGVGGIAKVSLLAQWAEPLVVTEAGGVQGNYFYDWESYSDAPQGYRVFWKEGPEGDYEDVTNMFWPYYRVTFSSPVVENPEVTLQFFQPGIWRVEFVAQVGFLGNNNVTYASASPSTPLSQGICHVEVTVVPSIKVWMDADNEDGFGLPDESPEEEAVKNAYEDPSKPGKVIFVNSNDVNDLNGNGNRITDFADGYFLDAVRTGVQNPVEQFVPLTIVIDPAIDVNTAVLKIAYQGSDPSAVDVHNEYDPIKGYTPGSGELRLWNCPGNVLRNGNSILTSPNDGNWVAPSSANGGFYKASAFRTAWNSTTRRITLYVEGMKKSTKAGDTQIQVFIDPSGAPGGNFKPWGSDACRCTQLQATILADTNRDGTVNSADEIGKTSFWSTRGAIVLNNCDNDANADPREHDNDNLIVDTAEDENDLAVIKIERLLLLPEGLNARLVVDNADKIRVFDNEAPRVARVGNLGGVPVNSFEIPRDGLLAQDVSYAAEALEYQSKTFEGGLITVALEIYQGQQVLGRDEICLKVAPYLLLGHENNVLRVFASDAYPLFTGEFDHDVGLWRAVHDAGLDAANDLALYSNAIYSNGTYWDVWPQDAFDIGYSSLPAGFSQHSMHVAASLPRPDLPLESFAKENLLSPDVGHFDTPDAHTPGLLGDYGGNIELVPPNAFPEGKFPQGMIVMGDKDLRRYPNLSYSPDLPDFLALQGVQGFRDNGTVTEPAGAKTLTDSNKHWVTVGPHWVMNDGIVGEGAPPERNTWIRSWVTITGGKGKGQSRLITGFDENTLTVSEDWEAGKEPDKSSIYHISSLLILNTDWLQIGHIDSVVKFTPNGKVLAGDPNLGIKVMADLLAKKDLGEEDLGVTVIAGDEDEVKCDASWTGGEWVNGLVYVDEGPGKGQLRRVLSSTTDTLTVERPWDPGEQPGYGSKLTVYAINEFGEADASSSTHETVVQPGSNWDTDEWKGGFIEITGGTLAGEVRQIAGNTSEVITVTRRWPVADQGHVTDADTYYLDDAGKNWTTNQWVGFHVRIDSGTGSPQDKIVIGNDADTIWIFGGWDNSLDGSSHYELGLYPDDTSEFKLTNRNAYRAMFHIQTLPEPEDLGTPSASPGPDLIVDSTKHFAPNEWDDGYVIVFHHSGTVFLRRVKQTVDSSTLELYSILPEAPTPSPSDRYVLVKDSLYWNPPYKTLPSVTTVWEILTNTGNLRTGRGEWAQDLVRKCQVTYRHIWGTDPATGGPGILKRLDYVGALAEGVIGVPDLIGYSGNAFTPAPPFVVAEPPIAIPTNGDNFTPCMVNMLIVNKYDVVIGAVPFPNGPKSSDNELAYDIFQDCLIENLGGNMGVRFINDWNGYHVGNGGVHCGTAEGRAIPAGDFWWFDW
jgi:hypothetical protein